MTGLLWLSSLTTLAALAWRARLAGRRVDHAEPRPMVDFYVVCATCGIRLGPAPTLTDAECAALVHHDQAHQAQR